MRLSRGRATVLRLFLALAVLAGVYVGLAAWLGGRIPANTTVEGVSVGGTSPQNAQATLGRALKARASTPVTLEAPESRTVSIDPVAAGLSLDLASTVEPLAAFSLRPADLWQRLTGGDTAPLRISADPVKLRAAVGRTAAKIDRPVKEGSISFTGGKVSMVPSVAGHSLDVEETMAALVAAWPRQPSVKAVVAVSEPTLSTAEITRANKAFATPAMSGPVTVKIGPTTARLTPAQVAPSIRLAKSPTGTLTPSLDGTSLLGALRAAAPGVERRPVSATVRLAGGRPVVVPAVVGQSFDAGTAVAAVLPALTSPARLATVATKAVQPPVTTAAAQAWRITQEVSQFTSVFPTGARNAARTHNIRIAVARLNGIVVKPGETFSLNGILGERTAGKGYQSAPVISGGRLTRDYGGGISQVSTTVFNAAFFAGVRIDRHTPHSFYISRYPEGREATVSWPGVDNQWTNDSGYGILIQASVGSNAISMRFWGTKVWDIGAVKGPRRNVTQPRTIVDATASCVPQSPSIGFDVTVTRIFKKNGATVRTSQFRTHYIPEDNVRCTHPSAG